MGGGLQHPHLVQLQPGEDAADGGAAQARCLRDAHACPALTPETFHTRDLLRRSGLAQSSRPRTAIRQTRDSVLAISPNPLAHRLPAEPALGRPSNTFPTKSSRPRTVSRA